jgi:hypothetical protein
MPQTRRRPWSWSTCALATTLTAAALSWGACGRDGGGSGTGGATGSGGATTNGTGGATGSDGAATNGTGGTANCNASADYDEMVLCDHPVAYWAMNKPSGNEPDLTGNGNTGTYQGAAPTAACLPNGDQAARFDGATGYLTVPSNASLSLPTTHNLTWEGWISADLLQFPHQSDDGYVDWMGKCADYAPTCEWEARMYSTTDAQNRANRLSAYIFNPGAGLGSAADWQPDDNLIAAKAWYHVVGEYTTLSQPSTCAGAASYPGSINIWVNGVPWSQPNHDPTGCMSQYSVTPKANGSPLNIGTMAGDTWFPGAIGKVAIYGVLLSPSQIANHYRTMTGRSPTGSCHDTCGL